MSFLTSTPGQNFSSTTAATRLVFIDNIRWVLIALVICHHSAVTYSHVGGWYYYASPNPALPTTLALATLETFDQAYFMGFLFFLAGYFVPAAFDSKGAGRFLRDRFMRLGIPTLFFMLVLHPVTVCVLLRDFADPAIPPLGQAYWPFLRSGKVLSASGPMWFALALLVFCVVYAVGRVWTPKPRVHGVSQPNHLHVIAFVLLISLCSFAVRIGQPIGSSVSNMQLGYFSQYILLFAAGVLAFRGNWLLTIPYSLGMFWMELALGITLPTWPILLWASGALQGRTAPLHGGVHWASAAFCVWESLLCMGMCLGLLVWFREKWNRAGPFAAFMSRNSYAAYVFHTPFLVLVTLSLQLLVAPALVKFVLASVIAAPLTFSISSLIRRLPFANKIL